MINMKKYSADKELLYHKESSTVLEEMLPSISKLEMGH